MVADGNRERKIRKMPIKLPNELPAVRILEDENIFVMTETRAITQDIRPLKILILNLVIHKISTFLLPGILFLQVRQANYSFCRLKA